MKSALVNYQILKIFFMITLFIISACSRNEPVILQISDVEAPSNLNAQALSSSQILLSWTDNSSDEQGFRIERALDSNGPFDVIDSIEIDEQSYYDEHLDSDTNYYYRIAAFDDEGFSPFTSVAMAKTFEAPEDKPDAPSDLLATFLGDSIFLTWQDNSSNEEGFIVEKSIPEEDIDFTFFSMVRPNQEFFEDGGLIPGRDNCYRVYAFNSIGDSSCTKVGCVYVPGEENEPPAAPTDLIATAGGSYSIDLSWTDNSSDERSFDIYRALSLSGNYIRIARLNPDVVTYEDEGLNPNTTYYYKVYATKGNLLSEPASGHATTDPETDLPAPEHFDYTDHYYWQGRDYICRFDFTWDPPAHTDDVTGYRFYTQINGGNWGFTNLGASQRTHEYELESHFDGDTKIAQNYVVAIYGSVEGLPTRVLTVGCGYGVVP